MSKAKTNPVVDSANETVAPVSRLNGVPRKNYMGKEAQAEILAAATAKKEAEPKLTKAQIAAAEKAAKKLADEKAAADAKKKEDAEKIKADKVAAREAKKKARDEKKAASASKAKAIVDKTGGARTELRHFSVLVGGVGGKAVEYGLHTRKEAEALAVTHSAYNSPLAIVQRVRTGMVVADELVCEVVYRPVANSITKSEQVILKAYGEEKCKAAYNCFLEGESLSVIIADLGTRRPRKALMAIDVGYKLSKR